MIVVQDKGEMTFWYPPRVRENIENDNEIAMEWMRMLEAHLEQLRARMVKPIMDSTVNALLVSRSWCSWFRVCNSSGR